MNKKYKKIPVCCERGTILTFDFKTAHSSLGNKSNGIRPIFIFEAEDVKEKTPLESNGKKAITFNYSYPKFFRNKLLIQIAKRILFFVKCFKY